MTRSFSYEAPEHCPACGGMTEIRMDNEVKSLYCTNPFCSAKKIKLFSHYVSRDAMNIDGLSEATLIKMTDRGFLSELYDLYTLSRHKEEITQMDGFGEKSCANLLTSIEKSRKTTLPRFIYSLGILNVGAANAKLICKHFNYSVEAVMEASTEEMVEIEGIGEVIASSVRDYFDNAHNQKVIERLLTFLHFEEMPEEWEGSHFLENKTFVITGSVARFKNRKELKEYIENLGGKVTGSVTKNTDFLINNDDLSNSAKNKKAKELEIPILTEDEFLKLTEEGKSR